jgi:uracil DNA glycosylase
MKTKLNEEKFSPLFGDWWKVIRPFWEDGGFDPIYDFLKFESRRGRKIAPLSSDTYRCFKETPLDKIKVVILGMC